MSTTNEILQTDTADAVIAKLLSSLREDPNYDVYGSIQNWSEIKNSVPMTNEEFEELERKD